MRNGFFLRARARIRAYYIEREGKTSVNNYTKTRNIILKNLNKKTLKKFEKLLKNS